MDTIALTLLVDISLLEMKRKATMTTPKRKKRKLMKKRRRKKAKVKPETKKLQ